MIQLRQARADETDLAMGFIDQAKAYLKEQGIDQWQQGYPDRACIQADLAAQTGYFLVEDQEAVGYLCIDFDGEPSYENLKGNWHSGGAYGVIHRMAIGRARQGTGLASRAFALAEDLCRKRAVHSIRVDTDGDNRKMRHLLKKNGYTYCGAVFFDYSEKIAFDKVF